MCLGRGLDFSFFIYLCLLFEYDLDLGICVFVVLFSRFSALYDLFYVTLLRGFRSLVAHLHVSLSDFQSSLRGHLMDSIVESLIK